MAQDRSNIIALHPDDTLPEGMVQIPEYDISFSGGPCGNRLRSHGRAGTCNLPALMAAPEVPELPESQAIQGHGRTAWTFAV